MERRMDSKRVVYTYNGIVFSLKKEKILQHMTTWMNVDDIMQNVIIQSQKDKYFMTSLYEAPKIIKLIEAEKGMVVARETGCQGTGDGAN